MPAPSQAHTWWEPLLPFASDETNECNRRHPRDDQAREAYAAAADHAARILAGLRGPLVVGGDHAAADAVLADPRLARLDVVAPWLAVPDPKRAVLEAAIADAQAVVIDVENA